LIVSETASDSGPALGAGGNPGVGQVRDRPDSNLEVGRSELAKRFLEQFQEWISSEQDIRAAALVG
jgi:hypothetical protein